MDKACLVLLLTLGLIASAQSREASTRKAAGGSGAQTFTGILLDAGCSEIRGKSSADRTAASKPAPRDATGGDQTGVTGSGGAAGNPNAGRTKAADKVPAATTAASGPDRASAQTGTTGSGTGAAGNAAVLPHQYRDCSVQPATTAFALYTDGRVLQLDDRSNSMVRKQLQPAGAPGPVNVEIKGSLRNDRIRATSLSRN